MEVLFTYNKTPLSRVIRKITNEPISHCVLKYGDFVLHSDLLGVRIEPYKVFLKRSIIHSRVELESNHTFILTAEKYVGKSYDYLGLIYLGLRYLFRALPKVNLWQTTGMFLCTEIVTEIINEKEDSLITPYQLYLKLKEF